jgi:hypothetical protein
VQFTPHALRIRAYRGCEKKYKEHQLAPSFLPGDHSFGTIRFPL